MATSDGLSKHVVVIIFCMVKPHLQAPILVLLLIKRSEWVYLLNAHVYPVTLFTMFSFEVEVEVNPL